MKRVILIVLDSVGIGEMPVPISMVIKVQIHFFMLMRKWEV